MKEVFIGEYIKHRRQELGLRQKELCEGICEPVTISRLENGRQYPSHSVMNALLQRLDLSAERYIAMLSDHEIQIENLRSEIETLSIRLGQSVAPERNRLQKEIRSKITDLKKHAEGDENRLIGQFVLRIEVKLGRKDGSAYSAEEQVQMLLEAMRMTVPQFDLNHITKFLYNLEEIKIVNQIACVYSSDGQYQKNADILGQLFEYIQAHSKNILDGRGHLPMIAHNYARALNLCGENEKALEIAELAQDACIMYRNYQMLPRIFHVMACTCHDMGRHVESQKFYRQAYYLCRSIKDEKNLKSLLDDAKRHYNLEFED